MLTLIESQAVYMNTLVQELMCTGNNLDSDPGLVCRNKQQP